jgi:hypothetical protein
MVDELFVLLSEVLVLHYNTAQSSLVWSRRSSVRTLTGHWVDDRGIYIRFQEESKIFIFTHTRLDSL